MDIIARISRNLTYWMGQHPDMNTLKKVSARSGVGFGTVQRAKNGDGNITVRNLEAIAKVFRRPVEELMGLTYGSTNVTPMLAREPPALPPRMAELLDLASQANERGQMELIGQARMLAHLYPAKAKRVN